MVDSDYMEEELDVTKLKYVLYARKSTDDPQRQIRSIPDQIFECKQLADRLGINIVKTLEETKSAKKPGNRPIFRQMLNDLKRGVYDGILAWNPDRLSRNMKEGGEIIDMVDENEIIDLKFVTHPFTRDANGKMLLGMAFVLSKQYSDDLSQKVTRGVRRGFAEGKSPVPKHGYFRDKRGLYQPDGKDFELIVNVWHLRSEGTSYNEIVKFLDSSGYSRKTRTGREIKITKQILTKVFKDPFYYGILIQNGQSNDLRGIYNFQPAITEEIYNKVQQLTYRKIKPYKGSRTAFYPLKMMIICSYCGSNMYVGPSTGHTRRYLLARCPGKTCPRKDKSIRMKIVFGFVYGFLKDGLNFTGKEYREYYDNLAQLADQKREKLTIEIHSKQGYLKTVKSELEERALNMYKLEKDSDTWKINDNKINELGSERQDVEGQIAKIKQQITGPNADRLSLESFLNLSKNANRIVQSANAVIKDEICREIFANFTVDSEKVLSYQLKEPFATLLKHRQMLSGRGERT